MNGERHTAVEIFAGGGGLAVGLNKAGFNTVAAVELEPHAAATFKANHPTVQVFRQDVRTVSGDMLASLSGGKIDVLAACPPCQGFSSLTSKWRREDERNNLINEVGRLAEEIRPRAIMMENVPGLAKKGKPLFDALLTHLKTLGYKPNSSVLQVADYGVPQHRRRLVMLAGLDFFIPMPGASHSVTGGDGKARWRTVRDTISEMDEPVTFPEAKERGGAQAFDWHVVRRLSPANADRLALSRPGGNWEDFPEDLRPPCHRQGYKGFSNVYGRMAWDEPSGTITAGCTTLSKGRFGHPEKDRTISLREAALLQTFPSDYRFETPFFERACEIVGNALPCVFAEAIARQVQQMMPSD
ncbi:MAG: DNA cytosine methyltransferase [Boseongicola sp.]|nr:DNA cytosine methyltransferase [Boseongicola sp.]